MQIHATKRSLAGGFYRHNRRSIRLAFLFCILIVIITSFFVVPAVHAAQTIPYKINFQGRLTDASGNIKPDGLYNMRLRLHTVATGGTAIWTETRDSTNRVQVTNGLFSIQLGDVTALSPSIFTNYPLYLEIELPTPATATCSTAACGTFTEGAMTPRSPLGSSPYAFNADTVDGIDGSSLARNDASNTFAIGATNTFNGKTQVNDTLSVVNSKAIGFNVTQSGANLQLQTAASGGYIMNDSTGLSISAVNAGSAGSNVTNAPTLKLVANNLLVQAAVDGGATYGDNLVSNPGFEFGCAGWALCEGITSAAAPASGASHLRFTQANTTTTYEILSRTIALQPGDQLHVSAKVKTSAPTTGQGGYYVRFMDSTGNAVSFDNGDWSNPGTSYATKTALHTAPAGAIYASIGLTVRGTGTTAGTWDFDDIYVKQVNQSSPILYKNALNSMYAFMIQNAAGSPLLVADTSNFEVRVGDGDVNPNDTPTLLVVDHKSTSGDPTGYNGAIYYNANSKKFRCYEGDVWKDCVSTPLNIRAGYLYQTDLVNGTYPANGLAIDPTLNAVFAGTAASLSPLGGESNHPGIVRASTGTTATGYGGLMTAFAAATAPVRLGSGAWSYLSNVRFPTLSDGSHNFTFRSGFFNNATTAAEGGVTNGCYLRYAHSVNGDRWQGVCRLASAETVCDTGAPVSTTAGWDVLNVVVNDGGTTATFTVNDTAQCTVSSGIPPSSTVMGYGFTIQKTLGSGTGSARTADVDYIDTRGTFQR